MIVSELKAERARIDQAIAALEGISTNYIKNVAQRASVGRTNGKHRLSAEGRKKISEMMKKRWAERRKKLAAKK
jgi:hypothetical protein